MRRLFALLTVAMFGLGGVLPASAQEVPGSELPATAIEINREATGGAQTLQDILRRQNGEQIDETFRSTLTGDPAQAAPITAPLGTLGGASDPELWRALRYGTADVVTTAGNPGAGLLVQDTGMTWLRFRDGPLRGYGAWFIAGVVLLLALFFLIRGRVRIDGGKSGIKIVRFNFIERFGHWLTASSFLTLAVTGLWSLYARLLLTSTNTPNDLDRITDRQDLSIVANITLVTKWIHDNVAWAFMLGLVLIFVMWVMENIPNKYDLKWLAKAGGFFSKNSHPPAKKFNAGQKIVFWGVVVLGISISLSGLSMLFPFQAPMFAKTFAVLNDLGLPQLVGYGPLPEALTPHAEMQLAQTWHTIIAFVFVGLILGHIYIGTIGMEGAFHAVGSGRVDLQWAKEHHSLWVEELRKDEDSNVPPSAGAPTPAE